jgi:hypothetical protein
MSEQHKKPYSKPSLTCYRDLRTITLGNSVFPIESPGRSKTPAEAGDSPFEVPRSRSTNSDDSGGRTGRSE